VDDAEKRTVDAEISESSSSYVQFRREYSTEFTLKVADRTIYVNDCTQ